MLLVDRTRREGVTDAVAYIVGGSLATAALAAAVGIFIRGLGSPGELLDWYFWPMWAAGVSVYDVGDVTGSVLRSIKAQLTAVAYGTQVLLDLAREPSVRADGLSRWFGGLTLVAYGVMAGLLIVLWRSRRSARERLLVPFTGCVVWLVAYKLFLNSWFQPASTEYHMVSLPPLLLLLLLRTDRRPAPGVGSRSAGLLDRERRGLARGARGRERVGGDPALARVRADEAGPDRSVPTRGPGRRSVRLQ